LPLTNERLEFRLLTEFRRLFEGRVYMHRASNQGDFVAMHLYEDLLSIDRSPKLARDVDEQRCVLNVANKRHGVKARRGDGTFGQIVPGETAITDEGYRVARGLIATVDIGVEVKILAKAMIKQIDRVINDLRNQVVEFRKGGGNPICVGIVGVNRADRYVGYEGEARSYPTTGTGGFLHPSQEAPEAERRLLSLAAPVFDEFLVLRFKATNESSYPFEWTNYTETVRDYGAALTRISGRYQNRG
jgi:hypothetical protein